MAEAKSLLKEGEFFNKWSSNRFKRNKNVLGTITGQTGSSKTYDALSLCENYYENVMNKPFPVENICFSLGEVAKRLNSGDIVTGEFLILEEAGANLGNLDYQNKMSKMFTYILQSFRSMNIGLIMTLPVLTMLNKQARQLIHFNFITTTIDYQKKIARVKPFFHQLNQQTGKSYWKFPRVKVNGNTFSLSRLRFSIPSQELIDKYEIRKAKFVTDLTAGFIAEYEKGEKEKMIKNARKELTEKQKIIFDLACEGYTQQKIADKLGKAISTINEQLQRIKKYGYLVQNNQKSLENSPNSVERQN